MKNSKTEKEILEENLVILRYSPNICCTQVVNLKDEPSKKFELDLEKRVWSFDKWEKIPIGTSRSDRDYRDGIIGVYDRTNIKHLNSMVNDAKKFTESLGSVLDD